MFYNSPFSNLSRIFCIRAFLHNSFSSMKAINSLDGFSTLVICILSISFLLLL